MKNDQLNRSRPSLVDDSSDDSGSIKLKQYSLMQFLTLISNLITVSVYLLCGGSYGG
jgi:hypothetical protein